MIRLPPGYRSKVGVAFFGGCGSNTLRLIIDNYDPAEYPDFFLFGANTDAKIQQCHFGRKEDPLLERWRNLLTIHQLGGETVTRGRGAGANPVIGRKAAETEDSIEAMRRFFEGVDEVILVGAVGGGTGTGSLPVAARVAVEIAKKPTIALVVTPDPDEGRTKRASVALKEIQAIVPTIPIRNAYLKEMMEGMTPEVRAKITFKDAWRIVNENSLVPMLLIIREILQVTGDMQNLDQADWETILAYGNHVFFGLAEVNPEKFDKISAEEIVEELCVGHFQDSGLIEKGKVVGLWGHGPWTFEKTKDIVRLIKSRMVKEGDDEPEAHLGIVHNVPDNKMWMAMVLVAKELPEPRSGAMEKKVRLNSKVLSGVLEKTPEPTKIPKKTEELPNVPVSTIRIVSGGRRINCSVNSELATRFNRTVDHIHTTEEELRELFEEVRMATNLRPDMPERFLPKPEEKKPGFTTLGIGLFPSRRASNS